MQITITPVQATKASIALRAYYSDKNDPDIEELLVALTQLLNSRPQEGRCLCGALIPLDTSGQLPEYCSDRCRQQAYRDRNKSRRYKASEAKRIQVKR
jgi:hypothetical protein